MNSGWKPLFFTNSTKPAFKRILSFVIKARVNLDHYVRCDLAYFGPRCSIFWYTRHVPWQKNDLQIFFENMGTHSFTFHVFCRKCISRGSHQAINWPFSITLTEQPVPCQWTRKETSWKNRQKMYLYKCKKKIWCEKTW